MNGLQGPHGLELATIAHTGTPLLYLGFSALVIVLLAADFVLLKAQGTHRVTVKEAATWSVIWILVAMGFAVWLWLHLTELHGREIANAKTVQFITGYFIEKGLAMENVFVWITIFSYFAIPPEYQKRVLLYGVIGAIVMRAILIYLGAVLIQSFDWIFYVFGAFLVFTGIKMFFFTGKQSDLENNALLRWLRGHMKVTTGLEGEQFFVVKQGVKYATPLFLVLVLVEVSDLIFAVDSIPAIFAVTSDPFIVFTANVFAILGLRAMYFLLADMADRFHLLGYGLALIVTLVGVKMLIMEFHKIPIPWMLATVLSILVLSIVASMSRPPLPKST